MLIDFKKKLEKITPLRLPDYLHYMDIVSVEWKCRCFEVRVM
jgi:hypothetical protein